MARTSPGVAGRFMAGVPILALATAPFAPMRPPGPSSAFLASDLSASDLPTRASFARAMPSIRPPVVEAGENHILPTDRARAMNAAIPFSARANPAASPFHFAGDGGNLLRAVDCLAAAQIYEAGDDATGEQAVAQVVLNRVRHPAFPKSICGVVFQGQERATGCQFTFSCDGALARTPSPAAWDRARTIARAALNGAVFRPVGLSTHYHTDWVVPHWSASLDKTARVGTHLFFRWTGEWGTAPAFQNAETGAEPVIDRIARLSLAHRSAGKSPVLPSALNAQAEASRSEMAQARVMSPVSKSWTASPATPLLLVAPQAREGEMGVEAGKGSGVRMALRPESRAVISQDKGQP